MKNERGGKIPVTGILIQDPLDGGYTAYFAQFPEAVAEGRTEDEALMNAMDALRVIMELKAEEVDNDKTGIPQGLVQHRNLELQIA